MYKPKGSQATYRPYETRRDVRRLDTKIHQALLSTDGGSYLVAINTSAVAILSFLPFGGELALGMSCLLRNIYATPEKRLHDFPWRVPKHAKLFDASKNLELLNSLNKGDVRKYNPQALYGEGATYYGVCRETNLPVYSTNSDDRTHLTCLGTTGSGKTEFLLGGVGNQLVQNSGLIYVDAKGDPALQRDVNRLARRFARDDDVLTINFITSGRNLARAQPDKITNTFNMMSNTSDGMLIELLNNLLDDSGGGSDMWKGRAMSFIAALTRVLTYLRDQGVIQLSPQTYTQYLELSALEELVFEHDGKYGEFFGSVASALSMYLTTLPGYNISPKARKKQEQKTIEQHGFIVMQLTKAINNLTYDYGHIFGVRQGDIDIFDCVLNRRILTIPLPALERSPDSLKLLGKLCIGSVKQMMAGSLGNRIEGLVREILDSRPTNSPNAFKLIFDEFGYIIISGVSVMPAQGRSLSFSISFAAQDFSDIKRGNEHEAEAIWGNSNIKAIGRIVTGENGDTMNKVNGVTGEEYQARSSSAELKVGDFHNSYTPATNTQIQKERVLPYNDLAGQENGEFTLLISKKEGGGASAGVKAIRIKSFYVAGPPLKYLRMNDLCPNFSIPVERLKSPNDRIEVVANILKDNHKRNIIGESNFLHSSEPYKQLKELKTDVFYSEDPIMCLRAFLKTRLDDAILDEQEFTTLDSAKTQQSSPSIHPDYQEQDSEQSEQSLRLNIGAAVRQSPQFNSRLHETITQNADPVSKEHTVDLDVKSALDNNGIEPINIFKLLNYANECEERLKQHDIQLLETRTNYGLLPFVPSHANEINNEFGDLTSRLRSLGERYLATKVVSSDVLEEADMLFDEIGFDVIKDITDVNLSNDTEASPIVDKREYMDKLLRIAIKTKGQIDII
ncbi:TraM recognition domain-containing protein [Pedobacter sp.]|uniref:TraM recognition domain-containing protein n=1 Tax=Pedobacter sp. TaxID=1411316 RepID=UPI003D7F71CF